MRGWLDHGPSPPAGGATLVARRKTEDLDLTRKFLNRLSLMGRPCLIKISKCKLANAESGSAAPNLRLSFQVRALPALTVTQLTPCHASGRIYLNSYVPVKLMPATVTSTRRTESAVGRGSPGTSSPEHPCNRSGQAIFVSRFNARRVFRKSD